MRVRCIAVVAAAALSLATVSSLTPAGAADDRSVVPRLALAVTAGDAGVVFFDPVTGALQGGKPNGLNVADITYSSAAGRGFVVDVSGGEGRILEISPLTGMPRRPVADGERVSLGGGGSVLAFSDDHGVTLRQLSTGAERRFPGPRVDTLSLSPDGTRVAFTFVESGEVRLLDTGSDGTLAEAEVVPPAGSTYPKVAFRAPRWLPDGRLGLVAGDRAVAYHPERRSVEDFGHHGVDRFEPAEVGGHAFLRSSAPTEGGYRWFRIEHGTVTGSLELPFREVSW